MSKAAKLVGVHIATMWRWYLHGVRGHKLPARLVGGRRYVLAADLDAFLNAIDSGPRARDATVDRRADEAGKL
ncbi:MAG: helix-turn-helix domain-containing protein [Tepidisphaeraceae bacterium]